MPGGALGRRVNHDPRSLRYLVNAPARTIASVEHERVAPILDQGALGSCTGNAAVGALGTRPLYDVLSPVQQSLLNEAMAVSIYSAATAIDPWPGAYPPDDTGSDGVSVATVCRTRGLIPGYLHATSLSAMQAALQDTPVIIGINWYEGFDEPDADGFVQIAGGIRGMHEIVVRRIDVGQRRFKGDNSWGLDWADRGSFEFSFADMDRLLHEDGDCTQLLPLTLPAPTPSPLDSTDAALIAAMDPWADSRNVWSRFTKAGKARAAYFEWKRANGV